MANGYVKAAQTIADDQTEVAPKLQDLLENEGVDASELSNLEITTFGANKFLIAITYSALRSIGLLTKSFGLKVSNPTLKQSVKRTLSVTFGMVSTLVELTRDINNAVESTFGFTAYFVFKISKTLRTSFGIKTVTPSITGTFNSGLGSVVGFGATFSASLNGIPIIV